MQIHVTSVTPNDQGGHTITIETSGVKAGGAGRLLVLGQDVTSALADGKVTMFEAMRIVADLTSL